MKSIAVFCGSSTGFSPEYGDLSFEIGRYLSNQKIKVIFGGGKIGLMGKLADGVLSGNGKIIGVIPNFLMAKELGHRGVTKLIEVSSMHERKLMIYSLSDAFLALPGGYGTMDELFEIITWGQLGLHHKPVAILNINGFFTHLLEQMDVMVKEGFLKTENRNMICSGNDIREIHRKMSEYKAAKTEKWLKADEI